MAVFVALLQADGRPVDPALQQRLASSVAFLGAPRSAVSPDGALTVAFAGGDTGFAQADAVSVAASGRLDDRAALAGALKVPPSASTADLVLAAYAKWGAGLLDHLIGDFAFALWDGGARRLIAATDQFGVRPIHYGAADGRLIVSTAIGPVRDSGLVDTALDDAFIADFLSVGISMDVAATVHRGVRRLPPAHRLVWAGGAPRAECYWRIPAPQAPLRLADHEAYAEQFRATFFAAVGDRLPPDGPITIQLSGGMDSTAIAAAACQIIGPEAAAARIQAHTIVYRGYPEEEGRLAQLVIDHLGLTGRQWVAEEFLLRPAPPQSARAGPQPDSVRELIPENAIVEGAAAIGATHLNGLGGDVLLWPAPVSPLAALASGKWTPAAVAHHLRLFGAFPPAGLRATARRWLRPPPRRPQPPWLRADLIRRVDLEARMDAVRRGRSEGAGAFHGPFWSHVASRSDPGNTGLDLPVGMPFMDVRLAALVARLPTPLLVGKQILREAMRPWLPAEIVNRPKTPLGQAAPYVARQPEVVARQLAALERAPELERWVDMARLRSAIQQRTSLDPRTLRCAALAVWLRSR